MSRDILRNKQTIIIHYCLINDERYDLVITPPRQSIGTKRKTPRKKIFNKQKQIIRKRFSKRRNAVSESETTAVQELHKLTDSINKNHQIDDQIYFTDSETTSPASIKRIRRIKKNYTNKPIRLYNWNPPIIHIENYTLTAIQHTKDSK